MDVQGVEGNKQGCRNIRTERKVQGKRLHKEARRAKREVFSYNGKWREEGRIMFAGYVTSPWNNTTSNLLGLAQTVVTDP